MKGEMTEVVVMMLAIKMELRKKLFDVAQRPKRPTIEKKCS